MNKKPSILLLGNVKEHNSPSMKIYLNYLKKIIPEAKIFEPSCRWIKPQIYKNFIYPLKIPRDYDIYHIVDHSYSYLAYFLPKEKTVVTCHDIIPLVSGSFKNKRAKLFFKYYISGLKRAKKIIVDSTNTKKDIERYDSRLKNKLVKIYPLEIDNKKFIKFSNREKLKKKSFGNKFLLLSVGSPFYKNTLLILKALNDLLNKNSEFLLLKVGDFTKKEELYIKSNNLKNFIIQKNNISDKKLVEFYNLCDILVFPSLYEGFGIPPLEAMACKTPVITSNVSSLPEVVGNAAIQINPNSKKELVEAIIRIVRNKKLRNSLILKGTQNLKRFSSKKQAEQLKKVYKEVLNNS